MSRSSPFAGDAGTVVAEFALALPAILLVLTFALAGVRAGALGVQAQDAAADAARGLARGDPPESVAARITISLPHATWRQWRGDGVLCVEVSTAVVGVAGDLGMVVSARSCALTAAR